MTQEKMWATLWVDSIDRADWRQRAREALSLNGVEQIQVDDNNGKVRIYYDPQNVTMFQLSAHLRAAGL